MRYLVRAALVAALLSCGTAARAQMGGGRGMGGPGIMGTGGFSPPTFLLRVFSPKLVMEHQQEIALTPAQVDAIKKAMSDTQQQLVDIQWRLDAESEGLDKLLASDHVDEAAVLAKLEQVTAIEQQVKKVNFTLLVRIKNLLDAQQQAKLRALRPAHPWGPPGGSPPPPQ